MANDADDLIARLAAEGEYDGSGGFTLDPRVALDKLREYQLVDPTRFVFSWVRAATLLDASRIDIEIDADDVYFRFEGEALTGADFDELWSSVVGRHSSARTRACRELALGINGAFAWEAKRVTVQAGALRVGFDPAFEMTRATLEPDEEDPRATEPAGTATVFHAKRPLGWDLIRRRYLDLRGELPEEIMLAQACAHARVPIYLEGRRLNPEREAPADLRYRLRIDEDGRRGVLSLVPGSESLLRVLKAGVEVGLFELPFTEGPVEVIIDDALLPLDLSQDKPVEGPRWQALLDCVSRARWHAYFALATLERWPSAEPDVLERALLRDIFACPDQSWTVAPGALDYANQVELPRAVSDPLGGFEALSTSDARDLRLPWPEPKPEPLTLGALVRFARRHGFVFTSSSEIGGLAFVPELPVLHQTSSPWLRALNEVRLSKDNGLAPYAKALEALHPLSGDRPLPSDWLELRHQHEGLSVRLAWQRGRSSPCSGALILGSAGKQRAQYALPAQWGPLWAEVEGPVPLDNDSDDHLATAVLAMLAPHADLLAALEGQQLTQLERDIVRAYLREGYGRWSARRLRECPQISADARERAVARWTGGWGVPEPWVQEPSDQGPVCEHAITELAWLQHGGGYVSLRDVQRELAVHARLSYVDPTDRQTEELPPEVWRLKSRDRALLSGFFHGALEPFDRRAWTRRAPGRHALPSALEGARVSVQLQGPDGERGLLALPQARVPGSWRGQSRRGARLRVLTRGHELGWMDLPLPLGPFYGVIEIPGLRAAPYTDVAIKDERWRAAAAIVEASALALARAQLDAWIDGSSVNDDLPRVTDWTIDLEHGAWPGFAAAWRAWQAGLPRSHPLRVDLDQKEQRT